MRLAGSPTSRGVSSMILVPSLAGGDPAPSHSKGSEETLLDFARFKPFHRRFWIPKAYIIDLAKGAWVLGATAWPPWHPPMLLLVPIDAVLI